MHHNTTTRVTHPSTPQNSPHPIHLVQDQPRPSSRDTPPRVFKIRHPTRSYVEYLDPTLTSVDGLAKPGTYRAALSAKVSPLLIQSSTQEQPTIHTTKTTTMFRLLYHLHRTPIHPIERKRGNALVIPISATQPRLNFRRSFQHASLSILSYLPRTRLSNITSHRLPACTESRPTDALPR